DCILDDEVQESCRNDKICTYPIWIRPFYDLLNREKGTYKVIVVDGKEKETYRLEELGLELAKDYTDAKGYHRYISIPKGLDPILGYNFTISADKELPGFVRFGDDSAEKTVVVLGGSTSDATFEPYKSWSELLYEKLIQSGVNANVYCGACAGYNSSQELNKLIRDVIPLKPDIIVSYSGYNDAFVKEPVKENYIKYPYYMYHQIDLMDSLTGYKNASNSNYEIKDKYILGIDHGTDRWEQYINNVRAAHAVAEAFNIRYFCFLQPCLIEKRKKWSLQEKEVYLNSGKTDFYFRTINDFYIKAVNYKAPFFHNITNLFDSAGDVYLDECHVNEKGNEIIAEYIGTFIKDYFI
ncbi:MAG: hypothetical protein NC124_19620, partial [Clostridium sp.]|nr:hypothetical protein [Clostridium sp.]